MTIITEKRADDWKAWLSNTPGTWEVGWTEAEAVGKLVISVSGSPASQIHVRRKGENFKLIRQEVEPIPLYDQILLEQEKMAGVYFDETRLKFMRLNYIEGAVRHNPPAMRAIMAWYDQWLEKQLST